MRHMMNLCMHLVLTQDETVESYGEYFFDPIERVKKTCFFIETHQKQNLKFKVPSFFEGDFGMLITDSNLLTSRQKNRNLGNSRRFVDDELQKLYSEDSKGKFENKVVNITFANF